MLIRKVLRVLSLYSRVRERERERRKRLAYILLISLPDLLQLSKLRFVGAVRAGGLQERRDTLSSLAHTLAE